MHAGDHEELPEGAEDHHSERGEDAAHVLQAKEECGDALTKEVTNGGKSDEHDGDNDDHREERSKQRGEDVGDVLLHELLDNCQNRNRQHDGKNGLGIVGRGHLITVDADGATFSSSGDDAGRNEDSAAQHAEHGAGAELFCGGVAQEDRQEVETGLVERRVKERVRRVGVAQQTKDLGAEDNCKGAEQTGGHDQRNELSHRAGEIVENCVPDALRGQLLLGLVGIEVLLDGRTPRNTGDGDELVEHLGHVLADDDLELATGELTTQNTLNLLDLLHVGLAVILERQTQARHAVGGDGDVFRTTHELEDIGGNLLVIYCHGTPPHIFVCPIT